MGYFARSAAVPAIGVSAAIAMAGSAFAAPGSIPATPPYEALGDGAYVQRIDPNEYGGATGTVTFHDDGYRGPGGASVNDFEIGDGFDPAHPSYVQDVQVVERDGKTTDPPSSPMTDGFGPHPVFDDANMDGSVNLGPFAWTTPPGTRFINMQIDRAGNYLVKREDMQWGFFDYFDYRPASGGPTTRENTQFNFQPYPLSDAYGWCGSVLASAPDAAESMAGQLVFDVAFDVYPFDGRPGGPEEPMTQVVPGFVMRSYGSYEVDVDWWGGEQKFSGSTVPNNYDPLTRTLDPAWHDKVSPMGAGVIPSGAWVLDEGTPEMRVVTRDTPGALWHRNMFAGAAFILRGDVARTVRRRPGVDYLDSSQWTGWPLASRGKGTPAITLSQVARRGARLLVTGELAGSGRVRVSLAGGSAAQGSTSAGSAQLSFGRFRASLPVPRHSGRRGTLTIRYAGDRNNLAGVLQRRVRLR